MKKLPRWIVQSFTTLITNLNLKGFINGTLYRGKLKSVCVPGLNCYSCPGAIGSCPIGSLQSVIGSPNKKFSFYIVGILLLISTAIGRFVCGWLCPFGWFQELIHKIPSKKFSTKKLYKLTYIKYIILVLFVIVLPITIVNELGMGNPYFCELICPVGILEGAIPLAIANPSIRGALGWLFTWKFIVLIGIISLSMFLYRPFCKWICPLGAIYGLFNKYSVYHIALNKNKCINCNKCSNACSMDIDVIKNQNHSECIRCNECVKSCPTKALKVKFGLKESEENQSEKISY
ncbi:4Fe-4S binding protein [Oceanirhabdus seepicola]|uniref:4Fe-4S binding protein n=1 Tax=Oceanirhabdus seepicola TaxID=2828781 RepID=A0A9J6P3R1_9CLOT|nr:4Fe-4S binding protein [Oceanirhabdus seepicola]